MNDRSTLLLEQHLKELKLPSFLQEYGKMAAQCAAEGVDHPQYLLRLAELELIPYAQARRIVRSGARGLPSERTRLGAPWTVPLLHRRCRSRWWLKWSSTLLVSRASPGFGGPHAALIYIWGAGGPTAGGRVPPPPSGRGRGIPPT